MLSSTTVPFDTIAVAYDDTFSKSVIGKYQRELTRQWLLEFLKHKQSLRILEINCGTGEDALWLASLGHEVVATDQSERMISTAEQKVQSYRENNRPQFIACSFNDLDTTFAPSQFDLIFSNFSGLNCISETELSKLNNRLNTLLTNNGHLAAVIFGKHTIWETLYYLSKANVKEAFRRWWNNEVSAKLSEDVYQPTYYFSIAKFKSLLGHFKQVQKKPIALFIPPSYLESYFRKQRGFFKLLVKLEKKFGSIGAFSSFADHVYILLKKK